ncbi:hypothetical protein H9P43_009172 [Blastocladiella emersonii ATCC 22665]|nr:hypothetical protein H9P43_009172 [Blastocladiella emersonii ATCC 22665]
MTPSPPPPPPPPGHPAPAVWTSETTNAAKADGTAPAFAVTVNVSNEPIFVFAPKAESTPAGAVWLYDVVKVSIPGAPLSRILPPLQLLYALGKLRAVRLTVDEYNASLALDEDDGRKRYARHHASDLFSVLAFRPTDPAAPLVVPGLAELIAAVEAHFATELATHRATVAAGSVEFAGLGELYVPGTTVVGATSLGPGATARAAYRVRSSWFEEKRTLFRVETSFHLRLEALVNFGRHLVLVSFEEVYSGWTGAKVRGLAELGAVLPATPDDLATLTARTEKILGVLGQGPHPFVEYSAGAFFPHARGTTKPSLSASVGGGRLVVDGKRGLMLGHFPSQGSDEVTLAILNTAGRYKRHAASLKSDDELPPVGTDAPLAFPISPSAVPPFLVPTVWPALVGFSFAAKAWGHVLVDALAPIQFNDTAFDQLVIPPARKRLIRALVKFGGRAAVDDLVAGKSGGSVFLLYGPPGTGKTVSAEAIAELLHKPLYYVTMGELGTTPEAMETRLGEVLDLCAGWDALVLIDEVDTFVERRTTSDVVRNAMVCVMLRLLEYHPGLLFLTTNRVREFDPAFESRITVALRYDNLDEPARAQVWRNLVARVRGIDVAHDLDYSALAKEPMNGRQIKNAVRLAVALAEDIGEPLSQALVEETVAIAALGRLQMADKDTYSL